MTRRPTVLGLACCAVAAGLLTGCGGGQDSTGLSSPTCASIWQASGSIPVSYVACANPSQPGSRHLCSSGRSLFSYGRLWGYNGKTIQSSSGPLTSDPAYEAALKSCT